MKRNILLVLATALLAFGLHAGKGKFSGSATVKNAPEFIVVDLTVKSECYGDPVMAMESNNKTATEVQELLKAHLMGGSEIDTILTSGGTTSPFSRSIYLEGERRTECEDTFQQTTEITFKTEDIEGFSKKFAMIQAQVLKTFERAQADENARTFVSIGTPYARVCEDTRKQMAKDALGLATKDAINNFNVCANAAGIDLGDAKLVSVTNEAEHHSVRMNFAGYERSKSAGSAESILETKFDDIAEYGSVTVGFKFPGTLICQETDE